jgi:hypothetical protein
MKDPTAQETASLSSRLLGLPWYGYVHPTSAEFIVHGASQPIEDHVHSTSCGLVRCLPLVGSGGSALA